MWPAPLRSRFGIGSYPGNPIRVPLLPNRDREEAGLARDVCPLPYGRGSKENEAGPRS